MRIIGPLALVFLTASVTGATAFDGCPHSPTETLSYGTPVDGSNTAFFDAFIVPAGDTATCADVAVDSGRPHDADTFVVYSADYRGNVELAEGETGRLIVDHDGMSDENLYAGSYSGDFDYRNYVGSDTDGFINSSVTLDMTDSADGASGAALDTIDYAEVAWTARGIVQASIDGLSAARTGIVVHLDATSDLLVGGNQPLEIPDSVAIVGALGSHTIGVTGHLNLDGGFALDGGVASFAEDLTDAQISGILFNARLSYLDPTASEWRPYGAVGLRVAPGMNMDFTRSYDDNTDDGATGTSSVDSSYFGVYAQGGMLWAPNADNSVLFSATLAQDWLGTDGWSEAMSEDNLFAASADAGTQSFSTFKLGADWTTALSDRFDLTLSGAVGHTFANDDLPVDVAFAGAFEGAAMDESFVQYGARLGWQLNDTWKADAFVTGVSGENSGTHAQIGAGLHAQF